MKLTYILLLSGDIPAAVRFWRDVMRLPLTFSDEKVGYAAFDIGYAGLGLSLYSHEGFAALLGEATPAPTPQGNAISLSFQVDDVNATYSDLVGRGARSVTQPQDRPEMATRNAYLSDPDDHVFEIYALLSGADAPTS